MSENPYRVAEYGEIEGVCEDYNVLIGPDGFQCYLGEPEDRTWYRDAYNVVTELNRLHNELTFYKLEARHWRKAFEEQRGGEVFNKMQEEVAKLRAEASFIPSI